MTPERRPDIFRFRTLRAPVFLLALLLFCVPRARATESQPTSAAATHPSASVEAGLSPAERSLWKTEEAFAAAFAARDPKRFASFLGEDVIFAGEQHALRGKAAVAEAWGKMMTSGNRAPFSWRPTRAIVSGDVGMTSGPVFDPDGKWVGAFTSVWRRQADGTWRIVLDGAPPCEAPKPDDAS